MFLYAYLSFSLFLFPLSIYLFSHEERVDRRDKRETIVQKEMERVGLRQRRGRWAEEEVCTHTGMHIVCVQIYIFSTHMRAHTYIHTNIYICLHTFICVFVSRHPPTVITGITYINDLIFLIITISNIIKIIFTTSCYHCCVTSSIMIIGTITVCLVSQYQEQYVL